MQAETHRVDVEKIAEAVLYEGYLLFPYRRSALKNQQRWTFGGVYPRPYSEASGGNDPWVMQTQCLLQGNPETELEIKVRFLHVLDRAVMERVKDQLCPVESLRVGGQVYRPWEEARERELRLSLEPDGAPLRLKDLTGKLRRFPLKITAGSEAEPLMAPTGESVGALLRTWQPLQAEIEAFAELLDIPTLSEPIYRLTVRILNTANWPAPHPEEPSRNEALRRTLVSTHTILQAHGGEFLSLLEPPEALQQAAQACDNIKTWPVLVGEEGERHTLLSSPIILYDYPQISPESQGNFFDATEIDELLTLGVMALTDAEKQEMRESDLHGRAILERTELLSEEQIQKLHGVVRSLQPSGGNRP